MKRIIWLAVLAVVTVFLFTPSLARASDREVEALQSPGLVIKAVAAGISGRASYEYIELYNSTSQDIYLDSWSLTHLRKDTIVTQGFLLRGMVKANSSVLFAGSDAELAVLSPDFTLKESVVTTGGIVRLTNAQQSIVEELKWGDAVTGGDALALATGSVLRHRFENGLPVVTGNNLQDFQTDSITSYSPEKGGYIPYQAPVNNCEGVVISEIAANVSSDRQFIELHNVTASPVTLDGCLLQTNRSTTKTYVLTGVLAEREYRAYTLASTDLQLTKTTTGSVYLLSSDGERETDARSYDSLSEETSWMQDDAGNWRQTFMLTPGGANVWQEFLPCEIGYERSADTGRCRKIEDEAVILECEAGKYRNAETGRCKTIETAEATAAPCRADQYRNPETNRCRSTASTTSTLVPCKENQERNPETNRCREVPSEIPTAGFSVKPDNEVSKTFSGWWALGGIGLLGLGYAGWEWRNEAMAAVRKVGTFFQSSK